MKHAYDIKLHAEGGHYSFWRGDHESVWDAIDSAHDRAKAEGLEDKAFAVSATRATEPPPIHPGSREAEPFWKAVSERGGPGA